jgi:hypothetical protein
MIFLYRPTPLAIILLCLVGLAIPPIGVLCLVLFAVSGALTLAAYIRVRREEATPEGKAFKAWEAHCRTKRRADLGKPDPVGDQLYEALRIARNGAGQRCPYDAPTVTNEAVSRLPAREGTQHELFEGHTATQGMGHHGRLQERQSLTVSRHDQAPRRPHRGTRRSRGQR